MIKPFRRRLAYVMAAVEHQPDRQNNPPPGTGAKMIELTAERDPQTRLIRPAADRNVQTPRAVAPVNPGSHAEHGDSVQQQGLQDELPEDFKDHRDGGARDKGRQYDP